MELLLDTHVWLWSALEPDRIGRKTRALLADTTNRLSVSVASAWEICIKAKCDKLRLPLPPPEYLRTRLRTLRTAVLPIELEHTLALDALEEHHRDPFDRIIIAQACVEGLTVVSADRRFQPYPIVVFDPSL